MIRRTDLRFALLLVLSAASLPAAFHIVPPDARLIRDAEAIVVATVTETHGEFLDNGDIATVSRLSIEQVLKGGDLLSDPVDVVDLGGIVGGQAMFVSEGVENAIGERALFFLARRGDGRWTTHAVSLGKFNFVADSQDRELLVRGLRRPIRGVTPDAVLHHERPRVAASFLAYIRMVVEGRVPPEGSPGSAPSSTVEEAAMTTTFVPETTSHVAPSAYTQGLYRWARFDAGQSVTYFVSGSQPGYDSIGTAQRALAAWTNDPGSNVMLQYGGTNSRGFVQDGVNTIVYNSSTDVPSGAVAFAKWYANATHSYKGETFYSISEGDVVVRSGLSVSQTVLDEVVTHEVGHTLGFRHSDQGTPTSSSAVMNSVVRGTFGATLGPWDIDAVTHVYTSVGGGAVPAIPTGLVATATSTTRVALSWSAVTGATSYEVLRSNNNSPFTRAATVTTNSFTDTLLTPGVTYLYRVRAVNAAGTSGETPTEWATTIVFSEDPLVPRVTVIRALHLTDIRSAVNAMRAAVGLGGLSFTDPSPAGATVKAVHITELRNGLTAALSALGRSASFTDPSLGRGSIVRAVHFQELRNLTK